MIENFNDPSFQKVDISKFKLPSTNANPPMPEVKEPKVKKGIVGFVGEYSDGWLFETETGLYPECVVDALDELLGYTTKDGEKYKITIEKL